MPGLSGLELQRRLASDNCSVPIVFMTAHYGEEVRTKAMEAGAVDVLSKPFTEKELFDAIGKSLATHKRSLTVLTKRAIKFGLSNREEMPCYKLSILLDTQVGPLQS